MKTLTFKQFWAEFVIESKKNKETLSKLNRFWLGILYACAFAFWVYYYCDDKISTWLFRRKLNKMFNSHVADMRKKYPVYQASVDAFVAGQKKSE